MNPQHNRSDRTDAGKVVRRFLGGMVGAGVVSLVGMAVGAILSAIFGTGALAGFMLLGIAVFAALGARIAWSGVTDDFGISLSLWLGGSVAAYIASLVGLGLGHNFINALPWVVIFATVGANVVPAIAWVRSGRLKGN